MEIDGMTAYLVVVTASSLTMHYGVLYVVIVPVGVASIEL